LPLATSVIATNFGARFSIQIGTTARTFQNFCKTSKVRNSVFRIMAERLGTSPEELLKGHFPDRQK
jgi:hypothetical protein